MANRVDREGQLNFNFYFKLSLLLATAPYARCLQYLVAHFNTD